MKKINIKKGLKVYVNYTYYRSGGNVTKKLTGIVDRVYKTVFGGCASDWGVSIILDKPHPVSGNKKVTYRITRVTLI